MSVEQEGAGRRGEEPTPSKAGRPDQKQTGKDHIAALSSIRADQDVKTFVADLRQHKKPLFSLMKDLMTYPADTPEEMQTRAVTVPLALYMHAALREYVFDKGDPSFESTRPHDEQLQGSKEAVAFDAARRVASNWLHVKPDSEAARAVSVLGIYAFPDQHHKLLQEMWPATLYTAYME